MLAAVLVHVKYGAFVNLGSRQVSALSIERDLRMLMKMYDKFVLDSSAMRSRTKCWQVDPSYFRWCWPDGKSAVSRLDNYQRCECCSNRILYVHCQYYNTTS